MAYLALISLFMQVSNNMRKFILRLICFFLILFCVDRAIGYTLMYVSKNCSGGYTGHHNYILDGSNEDILVMGSSRALHHYNPQIIGDSLKMSCLNCGQEGMGIIMDYGWLNMILERHHPKIVVYEIMPKYDLYIGEDNHKYLRWLKRHYDRFGISELFSDIDNREVFKMYSFMYRFNSSWQELIVDYIHPVYNISEAGFDPIEGDFDAMLTKQSEEGNRISNHDVDSLKLSYMEKFADICKCNDIKLIFVVSPMWYNDIDYNLDPIVETCKRSDASFLDFSNNSKYIHNDSIFKDGVHLNSRGADEYSKDFAKKIRNLILKN